MVIKCPCGVCEKPIAKNHNALKCAVCDNWVHIKCNHVSKTLYNTYTLEKSKWICIGCLNSNLPFSTINDKSFYLNSKGIRNDGDFDYFSFSLSASDKEITGQI